MKVTIIGASGKTGTKLVRESLKRGYQVVAVCRHSSVEKLDELIDRDRFTPYSMMDMLKASEMVKQRSDWDWTIVCAPTLRETPPVGYRFCKISEVTAAHVMSREDYAACLLDSLGNPDHHRRTLTVIPADG